MGKGGRWLGTRTLLPAWGWLHPKQARQEARVPGIQSAPQKSNMGWRHQLLHALSRVWKNKTQTWPQGDALLACIPTTCVSTGKGQQGNGDKTQKSGNTMWGCMRTADLVSLSPVFLQKMAKRQISCSRDVGAAGVWSAGERRQDFCSPRKPKTEPNPGNAQPALSREPGVSVCLDFKRRLLLLLKRLSSFPTETRVWAVKEHVNEENFPRAALLLSPKPSSFSLSYLYLFIKTKIK